MADLEESLEKSLLLSKGIMEKIAVDALKARRAVARQRLRVNKPLVRRQLVHSCPNLEQGHSLNINF